MARPDTTVEARTWEDQNPIAAFEGKPELEDLWRQGEAFYNSLAGILPVPYANKVLTMLGSMAFMAKLASEGTELPPLSKKAE